MINKEALYKCRCQLDFLALIVLIILLSFLTNLIFDLVSYINSENYTNMIVDTRVTIK